MSSRKSASSVAGKRTMALLKDLLRQSPPIEGNRPPADDSKDVMERISTRAYALYEERGYRYGCDLQDWLDAEREILSRQNPV